MKRVLAFGAFDPITKGQKYFLRQAKIMGDYLTVVVAHDSAILLHKGREQTKTAQERQKAVLKLDIADEVILGRKTADKYHILKELDFDVIAMGHSQKPDDETLRQELDNIGKQRVEIIRCKEYVPSFGADWNLVTKIVVTIFVVLAILAIAFTALQVQGS